MKPWMKIFLFVPFLMAADDSSCDGNRATSDQQQTVAQEKLLQEGVAQVGMPAIKNFREKRMLKMIFEMRDQEDLNTFTYVWPEMSLKPVFFCNSIGYPFPAATQYTNPQQVSYAANNIGVGVTSQADPNGLFSPSSAEATWVMCKNPHGPEVKPIYVEPRVFASPFRMEP